LQEISGLGTGLAICTLSLAAYALWGSVFAMACRLRAVAGLLSLMSIAALNVCAYWSAQWWAPPLRLPTQPAVVLASPVAAAFVLAFPGQGPGEWERLTTEDASRYGFGYPLLLIAGALLLLHWLGGREPRGKGEAKQGAGLAGGESAPVQ